MQLDENNLKNIIKEAIKEALPSQPKATLTIQECAAFSGIGRDKLLELVHNPRSEFPYFKVGAKYLVNRDLFIKWLEKISTERVTI